MDREGRMELHDQVRTWKTNGLTLTMIKIIRMVIVIEYIVNPFFPSLNLKQ